MRLDSPFVLAAAGTLAIHLMLIVLGDAYVAYNPLHAPPPAPHVEMFDVEVPAVIKPPPPPPPLPEIKQPEKLVEPTKTMAKTVVRQAERVPEPPPVQVPPPTTEPAGGEQVVHMDDVAPSAIGVGVAVGKRRSDRVGRGGSGGGTGAGVGIGTAETAPPVPTSVATIKKRAMPKGDFGYFKAGKDYPPQARQLGIEGKILVRLIVDETGKVRSTTLVSKLGHGLDELALTRAKDLVFEPAIDTDNRPVSSVVVWTFDMTLPK